MLKILLLLLIQHQNGHRTYGFEFNFFKIKTEFKGKMPIQTIKLSILFAPSG